MQLEIALPALKFKCLGEVEKVFNSTLQPEQKQKNTFIGEPKEITGDQEA